MEGNANIDTRLSALRRALQDPDEQVRANASKALEKLEAYADLNALVEQFREGDHVARIRALYAFGKIRSEISLKALVYGLRSENEEIRTAAIRALGEAKDPKALPEIKSAFESGDETTQIEVLGVVHEFPADDAYELAQSALRSKNVEVVDAAVQALGRIGRRDAENALLMVLQKGPARLRRSAALALGQLEI